MKKKSVGVKKILVIGGGGREHAICRALAKSDKNPEIFNLAPAINPGISEITGVENILLGDICGQENFEKAAEKFAPDLVVVGPENPLEAGAADFFESRNVPTFGPRKKIAQLETSKSFCRNLLKKYEIDASPEFEVFSSFDREKMLAFFNRFDGQIVVKADGLLGGKGVLVAGDHFENFEEIENFAADAVSKFGRVVLEQKLLGPEFSCLAFFDGETLKFCPIAQDHKRAFENDTGPQTGGMGTISDEKGSLPFLSPQNIESAREIMRQSLAAAQAETGETFRGILYGGFILTKFGVKLIEYNARFGDPEVYNILPILQNDFVEVLEKTVSGSLGQMGDLRFESVATVLKYLCPKGYPENPVKNEAISIAADLTETEKSQIFFASVFEKDGEIWLGGSRGIGVLGKGKDIFDAEKNAESIISKISGPLFRRTDIGTREFVQKKMAHWQSILGNPN